MSDSVSNSEIDCRFLVGEPEGDEQIILYCPSPDHEDKGRPNYTVYENGAYCFACGYTTSREEFVAWVADHEDEIRKPAEYQSRSNGKRRYSDSHINGTAEAYHRILIEGERRERCAYFSGRGIFKSSITRWKLGHTGWRFCIPVWSPDKNSPTGLRIASLHFRRDDEYDPNGITPKYTNLAGGGGHLFRPNPYGKITVVVEGPLDALLLSQYGYDAVTTSNGSKGLVGRLRKYFYPTKLFYLATDVGESGNTAREDLMELFPAAIPVLWEGAGKDCDLGEFIVKHDALDRTKVLSDLFR